MKPPRNRYQDLEAKVERHIALVRWRSAKDQIWVTSLVFGSCVLMSLLLRSWAAATILSTIGLLLIGVTVWDNHPIFTIKKPQR